MDGNPEHSKVMIKYMVENKLLDDNMLAEDRNKYYQKKRKIKDGNKL
jgi:hypothetical protein